MYFIIELLLLKTQREAAEAIDKICANHMLMLQTNTVAYSNVLDLRILSHSTLLTHPIQQEVCG
jgi:hypothetical protein